LLIADISTDAKESWPLSTEHLSIINTNTPKLVELLDTEYDLLLDMRTTNSLSGEQITYLKEVTHKRERNEKLLEMMKRRSISQFNEFIACLEKTQRHLIPFLTGDEGNFISAIILYFRVYFNF